MKKQPKPKPCMAFGVIGEGGRVCATRQFLGYAENVAKAWSCEGADYYVVRVRIVPVAPKKRAKAKRGGK